MEAKRLYPNTHHFILAKEIPSGKVGDIVSICDADGREELCVNWVRFDINCAAKYPDWFTPVTREQHIATCKENTIAFIMEEFSMSREIAEQRYANFISRKQ